jgi:putative heme-binding domain-containing protein
MPPHRLPPCSLALFLALAGCSCALASGRKTAGASAPDLPFRLPPGFVAERVAGPPLVQHPLMAALDDRGRLFVADSAGLNLPAPEILRRLPDAIRVLEDTHGDGRYDRATTFADRMSMPMGVLWLDGAVYAASPPSLWRLQEKDGRAARRTELVTKFGFTGNAADIHGPFLGPDGWLYWTDGRHGHEIKRPDGQVLKGFAARIFRCRPDGRDVEVVCGGGMDDPVEIAFTAEGEAIATVDILLGSPRRVDALIHCVEGGVFPYHPCYKEFKLTGGLLPPVTDLGWVAPSGLVRYRGDGFGPAYRNNLFGAQFNTHKVQRHVLQRVGASFTARNEDFLVSDDPDFHPTDVLEDADGSLLVIDTGAWFSHCPTSQIIKAGRQGAIYRIRRHGAARVADPYGRRVQWDRAAPRELAGLLDDPRWSVRDLAIRHLARRSPAAVAALREVRQAARSARARRNAVWALGRIEDPDARAALREALADQDAGVRQAAVHMVGLNRDAAALPVLEARVVRDTPPVRREAATAMGRLGRPAAVPALLKGLETSAADRFLEHALIFALIRIADREQTLQGLAAASPQVRRAALIALDQMEGGQLTREHVLPLLGADDAALQQAALDIVAARPAWAPDVVVFLGKELSRPTLTEARQDGLHRALLGLARDAAVQKLVAQTLAGTQTPRAARLLLLDVLAQAPLDPLPPAWVAALGPALASADEAVVRQALVTVRGRGLAGQDALLRRIAAATGRPPHVRVAALAAAAPRLPALDAPLFDFLRSRLDPALPPLARLAAAETLAIAHLSDAQLEALASAVQAAGPLELPHLLAAYERSHSEPVGKRLVAALGKSPGLAGLSAAALRRTLQAYPPEVQALAGGLRRRLEADAQGQKARLAELGPVLKGGDPGRGRSVFFGPKAACSACHTVGRDGGRVGPDLTHIGAIRTGQDLLEAVIFPSASIVRGYEPYVVTTKEGRSYTGILTRESADAIHLVSAERAEVRIPRAAVESLEPSGVSIMPQGLDGQLSRQELGDLIAFLRSLR